MKISLNWLKQHVNLDGVSTDELQRAVTFLGFEVEGPAVVAAELPAVDGLSVLKRFIANPERRSMPDIDVDFCFVRRDEVIRYVRDKYGHVAQIITFGTLKARAALRDVCRVLGVSLADADRVANRILGMGDVLALIEQAQASTDAAKAGALARKLQAGSGFDLADFGDQLVTQIVAELQGNPDINHVVAGVSDMVTGLTGALAGAGLTDQVTVSTHDINPALAEKLDEYAKQLRSIFGN